MNVARLLCLAAFPFAGACTPAQNTIPGEAVRPSGTLPADRDDSERLLQHTSVRASEVGAGPLEKLAFGAGIPGDSLDAFALVRKEECVLVYARGSEQVEDLDLHIFGDDGQEYGADEATDETPGFMLCPDRDLRLYVSARVAQGRGLIALGLQRTTREDAPRVAASVGAKGAHDPAEVTEPWPGLLEALGQHREAIGGSWKDQRRVALPVDSRVPTSVTVEVPSYGCLDILVLPGEDVSGLELSLQDLQTGRLIGQSEARGSQRSIVVCGGTELMRMSLTIRPRSGRGLAVLALSVSEERGAEERLRAPENAVLLRRPAQERLALAKPSKGESAMIDLKVGELVTRTENLKGCERFVLDPDSALMGYSLRAWDEHGNLWGATRSRGRTAVWLCGSGVVRLEGEALRRGGSLRIIRRRANLGAASLLSTVPLAASRLLEQLELAGLEAAQLKPKTVSVLELRATRLSEQTHTVQGGHCLTAILAGVIDGFGVELRVLDLDSHQERSFVRGADAVHSSICAEESETLHVRLEATALRGSGAAFLAAVIGPALP